MLIRAAVARQKGGPFSIEQVELADPQAAEVLVRVVASGICQTDLHARDGYFPIPFPAVYGHEGVGVVERVGADVTTVRTGDHVVMFAPSCGACRNCAAQRPAYCLSHLSLKMNGVRADGSSTLRAGVQKLGGSFFQQSCLATHAIATERNLIKVDAGVPLEVLAALPCGVNTGAGAAFNALGARPDMTVAILGVGAVGLAALMAAREAGCSTLIAVDLVHGRLTLARELGATHVLNGAATDLPVQMRAITDGLGVDGIIDTTGAPSMVADMTGALAMPGTYVLVGSVRPGVSAQFDMTTLQNGRILRGCIQGDSRPAEFIPRLVALYRGGRFPIDRLVTYYDLADINQAAADLQSGTTIKPVIRMPLR